MSINWDLIRINWNIDHKTNFQTRKEFLWSLYKEHKSCPKIADLLLISQISVNITLKKDGIKLLGKGHRFPSLKQKIIMDMNTSDKTISEIAKISKFKYQYIWFLLKKFKKEYKKRKKISEN